jgi:hypothetical protein
VETTIAKPSPGYDEGSHLSAPVQKLLESKGVPSSELIYWWQSGYKQEWKNWNFCKGLLASFVCPTALCLPIAMYKYDLCGQGDWFTGEWFNKNDALVLLTSKALILSNSPMGPMDFELATMPPPHVIDGFCAPIWKASCNYAFSRQVQVQVGTIQGMRTMSDGDGTASQTLIVSATFAAEDPRGAIRMIKDAMSKVTAAPTPQVMA